MKVFIATDGSDISIEAARQAVRLFPGADLTLVTARADEFVPGEMAGGFEGPLMSPEEADVFNTEATITAEGELARTADAITGTHTDELVVEGEAGPAVCEAAQDHGVDVIVVGSHGKGALKRTFLGSVSQHIIQHAPCPVLVVRHHK